MGGNFAWAVSPPPTPTHPSPRLSTPTHSRPHTRTRTRHRQGYIVKLNANLFPLRPCKIKNFLKFQVIFVSFRERERKNCHASRASGSSRRDGCDGALSSGALSSDVGVRSVTLGIEERWRR